MSALLNDPPFAERVRRVARLSPRERQVGAALVAMPAATEAVIARCLGISHKAFRGARNRLYLKLDVVNRAHFVSLYRDVQLLNGAPLDEQRQ